MKEIQKVETLGAPLMPRREALRLLGMGSLLGGIVRGASSSSVGLGGEFENAPFRSIGGFVDGRTLVLPSGQSVIVGKYGNPVLAPAAFHAAPLDNLNPEIVNLSELGQVFNLPQAAALEKLKDLRVYKFLIRDGDSYQQLDLSEQFLNPPSVKIDADGRLEISLGSEHIVSREDSCFVSALYHVDINRIDPNAFVAICEAGNAPSAINPIAVSELGMPLFVPAKNDWQGAKNIGFFEKGQPGSAESLEGRTFIRSGANLWRYAYQTDQNSKCLLQVDCRAHSDRADHEWGLMGVDKFYQLVQEGPRTVINPEPFRKNSLNLSKLAGTDTDLFGTGLIIWGVSDGKLTKEKFSLTNLADKGEVSLLPENLLRLTKDGRNIDARIIELKRKPGFAADTVDLIAVDMNNFPAGFSLPENPLLTELGSYDFMAAYRNTRELMAGL